MTNTKRKRRIVQPGANGDGEVGTVAAGSGLNDALRPDGFWTQVISGRLELSSVADLDAMRSSTFDQIDRLSNPAEIVAD